MSDDTGKRKMMKDIVTKYDERHKKPHKYDGT